MTYKNMKIEINSEQPLDEVVKELERLGYRKVGAIIDKPESFIVATIRGNYTWSSTRYIDLLYCLQAPTTLQQLREMK